MEHHHHQHGPAAEPDETAMAELLDLDAEVLHSYLSEVTAWIDALAAEPPRRILDLGSGTGTGALALVWRFPGADIIAVDKSAPLLHHLSGKARAVGVAGRIRIVPADLDARRPHRPHHENRLGRPVPLTRPRRRGAGAHHPHVRHRRQIIATIAVARQGLTPAEASSSEARAALALRSRASAQCPPSDPRTAQPAR